jgi:hypothetical protein
MYFSFPWSSVFPDSKKLGNFGGTQAFGGNKRSICFKDGLYRKVYHFLVTAKASPPVISPWECEARLPKLVASACCGGNLASRIPKGQGFLTPNNESIEKREESRKKKVYSELHTLHTSQI